MQQLVLNLLSFQKQAVKMLRLCVSVVALAAIVICVPLPEKLHVRGEYSPQGRTNSVFQEKTTN